MTALTWFRRVFAELRMGWPCRRCGAVLPTVQIYTDHVNAHILAERER
jgi:uncharacterized C2H2 Zn-finger protein